MNSRLETIELQQFDLELYTSLLNPHCRHTRIYALSPISLTMRGVNNLPFYNMNTHPLQLSHYSEGQLYGRAFTSFDDLVIHRTSAARFPGTEASNRWMSHVIVEILYFRV